MCWWWLLDGERDRKRDGQIQTFTDRQRHGRNEAAMARRSPDDISAQETATITGITTNHLICVSDTVGCQSINTTQVFAVQTGFSLMHTQKVI